tara:strand:- start:319 stop:513 length:195 start_codon:yes stop_codon:yes gene_type:complete
MIDMVQSMKTSVEHRVFALERELNFAHREIEQLNKVTRMHRDLIKFMERGLREKFKKLEEKAND